MKRVILNADVGEEAGFDAQIMPYISWCNIACGSHAGSDQVIEETVELAIENNVKIGAHPSYPDRENFGRISMSMKYDDLVKTIKDQIQKVKLCVEKSGAKLHHVKPHGALYNDAIKNTKVARAILEAILDIDNNLKVVTLHNSVLSNLCNGKLIVKNETFADRNYNDDLTLVSRTESNAVITDPKEVFDHVFEMVSEGKVRTKTRNKITISFDTICVHGDNPRSVEILDYIYKRFSDLNFVLK